MQVNWSFSYYILEFYLLYVRDSMDFHGSSAGKESACSAGDPSLIPWSWRSPGERDRLPTLVSLGFPDGSTGKEFTCNAGDLGSISGLERSDIY